MTRPETDRSVSQIGTVLYTAKTRTTGGRTRGSSRSCDGQLDVKLSIPGTAHPGTNPEQLFAAGWSACFESAISLVAQKRRIAPPADLTIDAEVDLNTGEAGYFLGVRLNVSLSGIDSEIAQSLIDEAHRVCPYSKATRGNIEVVIRLLQVP